MDRRWKALITITSIMGAIVGFLLLRGFRMSAHGGPPPVAPEGTTAERAPVGVA